MLPELPEEIWSLVLRATTDVEHPHSIFWFKLFKAKPCTHGIREKNVRHVLPMHVEESGNECFVPSHIRAASLVSRTFRRLSLPFLYQGMLVQLPCSCVNEGKSLITQELDQTKYADLVQTLLVQEREGQTHDDQNMTPQTTWSIYSSILRYFPRAKTVHLRGHHVNLANCPTPFLSLLSTCFDRVTIPVLDTRMSNTNSTPNTSGIDLSRFTVERAVVANVSNVRRIQDFSGLRVQGLDLASPFPAPGFQEAWSALSYPGLTTLSIFGTVEAASNSSSFYDFVSRHPELETVYIQTEENLEQSTFPLLRKLYQGFRAPSFVHVKYALFERVSNSSSTVSFDCPELSVRTIAGSLSSLADLIARVEICCPSVTDLTIEAMNLGPMDFEFEPGFFKDIFSLLTQISYLGFHELWIPPSFPSALSSLPFIKNLDSERRDIVYFSLQLAYQIASEVPSLQTIEISWQSHDDPAFWYLCCCSVKRDSGTGTVQSVEEMGDREAFDSQGQIVAVCWPPES